jgi:hypothetical protein
MTMLRAAAIVTLALAASAPAQPPVAGRWVGEWVSDANGHHGPLRAKVTPAGDGYDVRFVGRFAKVIPFVYRQHLAATGTAGDTVFLSAERRLPLFGTFRMDASANATAFDARFTSGRDSGRFVLRR